MVFDRKKYMKKYNATKKAKEGRKKYCKKWRIENKKKVNKYAREWKNKHRKQINKHVKEYRKQNKKRIRKYNKGYTNKNNKDNKEYINKYGKKNRKKINKRRRERGLNIIYSRKRRAKINSIIEDFSNKEWLAKLEATKGFCPKCGKYIGIAHLTLDHIYPVSRAYKDYKRTGIKGVYTIDDVQPLCRSCNTRKGAKIDK